MDDRAGAHAAGLAPSLALAAKKADVVIVADTRKLDGILYWWAEMYNESHFLFAIVTMIIIPLVGCVLGWLADIVMSHIGVRSQTPRNRRKIGGEEVWTGYTS